MNVAAAGFALQDPSSPQRKVYAACVVPAGAEFLVITGYGAEAKWNGNTLIVAEHRFPNLASASKHLETIWTDKEKKGYSSALAGPDAFTANNHTGQPHEIIEGLKNLPPMRHAVTQVRDAVNRLGGAPMRQGPRLSSRRGLRLNPTERNGITLSNGKTMFSRQVAGHADVQLLRKLRDSGSHLHARLYGPPGTGKTMLPMGAFGDDLVIVGGHGDMTPADLVGKHVPVPGGEYRWEDGPLTIAAREGRPFYLDEATRVPAETLAVLMSITDSRRELRLDDRPDDPIVSATDGFWAVLGYNETGQGVRPLDPAIMRRFPIAIKVDADVSLATQLGIDERLIRIQKVLSERHDAAKDNGEIEGRWFPQIADLQVGQDVLSHDLGDEVATGTLISACIAATGDDTDDNPSLIDLRDAITAEFSIEDPQQLQLGGRAL